MKTTPLPLLICALAVSLGACQPRDVDPTTDASAAPSSYCPNTGPIGGGETPPTDVVEGCQQFDNEWSGLDVRYCNPAYGTSDDCYACMVERCCLQFICGGDSAWRRFKAEDGPEISAEWSRYSLDPSVDPDQFKVAYSMHVACARACVDDPPPAVGAEVPPAERPRSCVKYCTELITPNCPDANGLWWYREATDSLFECMFAGPEVNETLVQGYAYASWVRPGPNEPKPYVPRFADSSCAEVCFAPR